MQEYEPIFWDIETTGLNPMAEHYWSNKPKAQVTAVGLGIMENWREADSFAEAEPDVAVLSGENEYDLIQRVVKATKSLPRRMGAEDREPFLVGYNSRSYDHPYFSARGGRLRLNTEPITSDWKRLDMQRVAKVDNCIASKYPKEDEWAEALGITVDDQYTGKDMPDAFERRDWDAIHEHVDSDVEVMMECFFKRRGMCMDTFYGHYGIDLDASYERIDDPVKEDNVEKVTLGEDDDGEDGGKFDDFHDML